VVWFGYVVIGQEKQEKRNSFFVNFKPITTYHKTKWHRQKYTTHTRRKKQPTERHSLSKAYTAGSKKSPYPLAKPTSETRNIRAGASRAKVRGQI
jgi:hypothetical protein